MKILPSIATAVLLSGLSVTLLAFQGRVFEEDEDAPGLAAQAHENAEWGFAQSRSAIHHGRTAPHEAPCAGCGTSCRCGLGRTVQLAVDLYGTWQWLESQRGRGGTAPPVPAEGRIS